MKSCAFEELKMSCIENCSILLGYHSRGSGVRPVFCPLRALRIATVSEFLWVLSL
jgi:hypothetical protein